MRLVDVLDILAVMIGIWFTIRKLDAQGREASAFPHVAESDFLAWQKREVTVYQQGSLACFLKVFLDLGFTYFIAGSVPFALARLVSGVLDIAWIALVVLTAVRSMGARRMRGDLGIYLGSVPLPKRERDEQWDDESDGGFEPDDGVDHDVKPKAQP